MILLTGNSLGERQKDLNEKVNKAVADNTFEYKKELGNNDIDKIFIIDLAAKQKNIDVILETLKSGNIVHITRALNKCPWLSQDDFANIINVDNLHSNIFPSMSIKMKKKLLCMLSTNLKTESRAIAFHEYCIKEGLIKIAMKFLFNTPESFKIDIILLKSTAFNMVLSNQEEAVANLIGNSFILAQTFLDNTEAGQNRNNVLDLLRYMYSISGDRYLDLLEKYKTTEYWGRCTPSRLGSRLSKEIIKKHKSRVLKNPLLYINLLNKDKIAKNSTISDVKVYTVSLLPNEVSTFWNDNFYKKYKFILDIIPAHERFSFIRKIFIEKYSDEKFEMSMQFYSLNFYNTMTNEEKETWALHHITTGDEILGSGNDYIWYKFVSFDKAFEAIKKYILITTDSEKRTEIINVLVDSAKTPKDLETLLNYYYNRHVNESTSNTKQFIDCIIEKHRVLHFDENCWTALEKIFYSLNVYSNTTAEYRYGRYRAITLIYYIINEKTVPKELNEFLVSAFVNTYMAERCCDEPEKRNIMVFSYIHKYYLTIIESTDPRNDDEKLVLYIKRYLNLLHSFNKTKDDIADVVNNLIHENWDEFKHNVLFSVKRFSERNIIKFMKTDAKLVIDKFPLIKQYIQGRSGKINWLLRKLKLYFQHDIAQRYLQLLNDCLSTEDAHYRMVQVAVYGVFILADDAFKIEFMRKYVPTNPKIDHANISRDLIRIQEAICGYSCVSQPPLPIACILQYLTGDYVHNCLPMFNYYLMNLPLPECIAFVESIIDKPVSIQKHGLRLAFQCFSTENLKTLINDLWKRTKNISMRKILYKSLYDKILKEKEQTQLTLFDVLNRLTLDLHQDDDKEVFCLLTHNKMPSHLEGQYLVSAWKCVEKLPEKSANLDRMTEVINSIENSLNLVPENETIAIMNAHVYKMLDEKEILNNDIKKEELLKAKWELTLRYLANVYNEKQLKDNLKVVRHILKMCLEMRNEVRQEKYVIREFIMHFIKDLECKSYNYHEINSYSNMKILCNAILKDLQEALPECEIFTLTLELRMSDITRDTILSCAQEFEKNDKNEIVAAIRTCFAKFANDFVVLLKEYIQNGKWFSSFHSQVDSELTEQLARVNRLIDDNYTVILNSDDQSVLLCVCLLKYEIAEVYLLILRLLPTDYSGMFASDYIKTLSTVQMFKNTEVQYFMLEKFVNSDFIFRKQMLTQIS